MCHTGRPLGRPCKHCSVTALITEAESGREGYRRRDGNIWEEEEGVTTREKEG